jgi:hypothetical protein
VADSSHKRKRSRSPNESRRSKSKRSKSPEIKKHETRSETSKKKKHSNSPDLSIKETSSQKNQDKEKEKETSSQKKKETRSSSQKKKSSRNTSRSSDSSPRRRKRNHKSSSRSDSSERVKRNLKKRGRYEDSSSSYSESERTEKDLNGGYEPEVIPDLPIEDYFLNEPIPLVGTSGVVWSYQQSPGLKQLLQKEISAHYDYWKKMIYDKTVHPLFLVLSGAGTGKSRLLQEFPRLSKETIGTTDNTELIDRLQDSYVFNISFENGTPFMHAIDTSAERAIALRMLWQLYSRKDLLDFQSWTSDIPNHITIHDVFRLLGELLDRDLEDMTVFLMIDGTQRALNKDGLFYDIFSSVSMLINQSPVFIIGCCAATVTVPVSQVLAGSSQRRISLKVPLLNGKEIFRGFLRGNPILDLLIDDMGGNGRALEILEDQWKIYLKSPEIYDIPTLMTNLRSDLQSVYADISDATSHFIPILRAIMTKHEFNEAADIIPGTEWTVDKACSSGLINFNTDPEYPNTLSCAFVWLWLLTSRKHDNLYQLVTGIYDNSAGDKVNFPTWPQFEKFNAHYRCLKSQLFDGQIVPMSKFHDGAVLNGDIYIKIKPLKLSHTTQRQYQAKTKKQDIILSNNESSQESEDSNFFVNHISGDAWCQLIPDPRIIEIQQYKVDQNQNITHDLYKSERSKAAKDDDFFILFSNHKNTLDAHKLPTRSGLVTTQHYKKYYGPFAGRAIFMTTQSNLFSINTATQQQLLTIPGIGLERSEIIMQERKKKPFNNLEDCLTRTWLPVTLLENFFFSN